MSGWTRRRAAISRQADGQKLCEFRFTRRGEDGAIVAREIKFTRTGEAGLTEADYDKAEEMLPEAEGAEGGVSND
jgi:hypothetical protein